MILSVGFESNLKMGTNNSQYRVEHDENVEEKLLHKPKHRSRQRQFRVDADQREHLQRRQSRQRQNSRRGSRQRGERCQKVKRNSKPKTWEQQRATIIKLWRSDGIKTRQLYCQRREMEEMKKILHQMEYDLEQRNKTIRSLRDLKSGNSFDGSFFGTLFEQ